MRWEQGEHRGEEELDEQREPGLQHPGREGDTRREHERERRAVACAG